MTIPAIIKTERLILRPFRETDKAPYAELGTDPEVMKYFPSLMSKETCDAKIDTFEKRRATDGFHFLAAELTQTGEFVGMVGLAKLDKITTSAIRGAPEVEIGWVVHSKFRGLGLAPEGARACLAHAWEHLKLQEIVAFTAKPNRPSERVMQKIGMQRDPGDDFEHPHVPKGHRLRPHLLYRISSPLEET